MKTCYSVEIDAPPERVFYWLDNPHRVMQWLPNVVENENLVVTPNKVGSTFRQVYVENGRRIEMFGTVTAYEANRRLASEITGKQFDLSVDYRLEDLGGRTRLTQEAEPRFKGIFKIVGLLLMPLVKKAYEKQQDDCFATLKRLAESGAEAPADA